MKIFKTESIFNNENDEWEEHYFVDDEEVCMDDYYKLMDLEMEDDDYDCEREYSDSDIEIMKLLYHYTHSVIDASPCEECVFDLIQELAFKFYSIGISDCKSAVEEFVGDID